MQYPNTKQTDLRALHNAIAARLKELFPESSVAFYERFDDTPPAGSINFGLSQITQTDDIATEQFSATLDWDVFFIGDNLDDAQGLVSAFENAATLLAALSLGERFSSNVSAPRVEGAFVDVISYGGDNAGGANNASATVAVRVSFAHDAILGANVHEADTFIFKQGIGDDKTDV